MVFAILVSVLFSMTPSLHYIGGQYGGRGGIKMASASTPSANEPAKDLILVHSTAKTSNKSTNLRKNGI